MTKLEELTMCIKEFSADAINTLLDAVNMLFALEDIQGISGCPYCNGRKTILYG